MIISKNSNVYLLPLFYFLPEEIVLAQPTLSKVPRKIRTVFNSQEMTNLVESDSFFGELADSVAALVFPHFGFRGWKEDYTGYFPVWKLTYALPLWLDALNKEINLNLQTLLNIPSNIEIPFMPNEYIYVTMQQIVKRVIEEQNWKPMLEVIKEMPCDEDFEPRNSNVKKDFLRKWYHTRNKKVKSISLESYLDDENNSFHDMVDHSSSFEEAIVAEDYANGFIETLSEKDMEILNMRMNGFTYEKIATMLGYKTHSGIVKRMKIITDRFLKYEEKYNI